MSEINLDLIPGSTRNYSGISEEIGGGKRQSTHYGYMGLDGKESDFTMSDLISIGVLWARSIEKDFDKVKFYKNAFESLRKAFGNPDVSEFLEILGIKPKKEDKNPNRSLENMFRKSGIVRFLWFRAKMIEVQDPFWRVMEGDIWGRRAHPKNKLNTEAIEDGINFYEEVITVFTNGLPRLDKAICTHFGWKYDGKISLSELKSKYKFPDPSVYFDDDF